MQTFVFWISHVNWCWEIFNVYINACCCAYKALQFFYLVIFVLIYSSIVNKYHVIVSIVVVPKKKFEYDGCMQMRAYKLFLKMINMSTHFKNKKLFSNVTFSNLISYIIRYEERKCKKISIRQSDLNVKRSGF